METQKYQPNNKVRVVTAASLFDGHDAAINIMRRVIQGTGCEVIHLGHDKSAEEVVNCAIQEDANAIALTSYQGGHNEYFKYIYDLLREKNSPQIKIFGGGGGVILPEEIKDLMEYGIDRIYSPDDGREMGLQGMIDDLVQKSDFATGENITVSDIENIKFEDAKSIAQVISAVENFSDEKPELVEALKEKAKHFNIPIIGITGTGGAGKSSLTDELVRRFLRANADKKIAIISVDPSKKKTGGALLGDRIRMNSINDKRVYMRSMATRENNVSVSPYIHSALDVLKISNPDIIILETSGIGQSGSEITEIADVSMYVMTPEYGASTQLEKIDMLDYADLIALNKSDKRGALDALQAVRKQYQRNHTLFEQPLDEMPVFSTKASQFNDWGTTEVYNQLIKKLNSKFSELNLNEYSEQNVAEDSTIIPPKRVRYLSEIVDNNKNYDKQVEEQALIAKKMYLIDGAKALITDDDHTTDKLEKVFLKTKKELSEENRLFLQGWHHFKEEMQQDSFSYLVRGKEIKVETKYESLSHL